MTTSVPRRGGFTLIELLVVIALIGVLAALAAGTFFRIRASQMASATESTQTKLHTGLDKLWKATLDQSASDSTNGKIPDAVFQFAGSDKERAKVLWTYLRLKNQFPTSLAEARIDLFIVSNGASSGVLLPHQKMFDSNLPATPAFTAQTGAFAGLPPVAGTGTPEESAALLYITLTSTGLRGEAFSLDGIQGQVGEIDLYGTKVKVFKDAWGTPITFVRMGFGYSTASLKSEADAEPYIKDGVRFRDPLDPLGKLVTPSSLWSVSWATPQYPSPPTPNSLDQFWNVAAAGHLVNCGVPTTYSSGPAALPITRNWIQGTVAAGANKKFIGSSANLFNTIDDDLSTDNQIGFRLRREGNKGN